MGAYIRTNGGVVPAKAAQFLPGPYRIRDIALTVEAFVTSKTPVGTLRAPGRFEANFFRERLLDIVADDLGLDPMDFRRKNLIKEAELPFHTGKLVPYEPETDFDTGDYHVTFERAVAEIGWDKNKAMQGQLIDGRYHGLCRGAVRRERRLGQGEFAARHREGRLGQRLCRLVGAGAGAGDDPGPGRRRNAEAAVREDQNSAWLDHVSARRLRHFCLALDGGRRLRGDGRLQQSARRHSCGGEGAPGLSQ